MKIRLAGGVVAGAGLHAWIARPSGPARIADESEAPPGAAVALGPADASDGQVQCAVTELGRLVEAGGVVAAGAGVDLGGGFRSACLAGGRGDRRDAVLAALKVLGLDGVDRLGDRAGFVVALFGSEATKRVGVAAGQAISEGRWAALHLASAASDVLGPEQLEQVLALTAPDGVDLISGGLASVLAGHLTRVLEPVPRPRRLVLLVDLVLMAVVRGQRCQDVGYAVLARRLDGAALRSGLHAATSPPDEMARMRAGYLQWLLDHPDATQPKPSQWRAWLAAEGHSSAETVT